MTVTAKNDHLGRRGSSPVLTTGASPSLTVTKNVNGSAAVSEEHRVQASEYLACYIEVPSATLCFSDFPYNFIDLLHHVAFFL